MTAKAVPGGRWRSWQTCAKQKASCGGGKDWLPVREKHWLSSGVGGNGHVHREREQVRREESCDVQG